MPRKTFPTPLPPIPDYSGMHILVIENNLVRTSEQDDLCFSRLARLRLQCTADMEPQPKPETAIPSALHNAVCTVCLENPFWNDFRLLHYFNKQHIPLTAEELQSIKQQMNVATKEAVCHALYSRYGKSKTALSDQQIRFIERVNPVFLDRGLQTANPGKLLAYEVICLRGIDGMLYIHLFLDLYNGYAFGKLHRDRCLEIGCDFLHSRVMPYYENKRTAISSIRYHCKDSSESATLRKIQKSSTAAPPVKWIKSANDSGTIQAFRKFVLEDFFVGMKEYRTPMSMLESALTRWLIMYNLEHPFEERRDLFDYAQA